MTQRSSRQPLARRNDTGAQVGQRLRHLRREQELTLMQVATRTGIAVSTLSKIENARMSPSFDIIKRLCDGLGLPLEDMVGPGAAPATALVALRGQKTTTRHGQGSGFRCAQYDYTAHATELFRKAMVPLEILVRARSLDDFDHWSRHTGEEFVFVLSGEVEIHTELYAPFRLQTGESAYFDSAMAHVYLSVGPQDARVLSVSCDLGQTQMPVAQFMHADASPVARHRKD